MNQHQFIYFSLHLSYEQFLQVYQGLVKNISVIADDGRRIEFPALNIQSFLTRDGISGQFKMELNQNNKFVSMTQLD